MRRPLVVSGSRLLPESLSALSAFATVAANADPTPWDAAELRRRAADADAIIAFMPDRIDEHLLDGCRRLRLVAGALKGCDNIDVQACLARGVRVTIIDDLLSAPTAELGIGLLLALLRQLRSGDAVVRSGHTGWRPEMYGGSLVGAGIGVLGMGGVGRALARLLRGFEARISYYDPRRLAVGEERDLGITWCSADDLARQATTALVLAAPLTAATCGWLDRARLACLPAEAVVVNIGRGSVADEGAVLAGLQAGTLAGYAADVFAFEDRSLPGRPAGIDPRLLGHPRTCFTPHLGSAVREVRLAIERHAIAAVHDHVAVARSSAG